MEITRGIIARAQKVVLYGAEGVGKSTFASHFPNVVFIDVEDSTINMDVPRFPKPTSWEMLMQELEAVRQNPGEIKTLAIDTIDWAERLAKDSVINAGGASIKSIEDFGYGKGYTMLAEKFGKFLDKCTEIKDRGVNVVLLAHAAMRKQELPDEMGAFDRWELKLEKKVAPMVKEWADLLLFANYKTFIVEDSKTKTKKATGGQNRVMYTTHHATRDAKNRHGLPDELPFEFAQIAHIFGQASNSTPKVTESEIKAQEKPREAVKAEPVTEKPAEKIAEPAPVNQEPTYPANVPGKLVDLLKASGFTAQDVVDYLISEGSFPGGMKAENVPEDPWNWVMSNWEPVRAKVQKLKIEF